MQRPSRPAARALPLSAGIALLLAVSLRAGTASDSGSVGRSAARPAAAPFLHSDECVACHNALTTPSGEDVSIGAAWRGTMMANSARDPYFRASVRRETIDHPLRAGEIQDECAACHLPAAHRAAQAAGRHAVVLAPRLAVQRILEALDHTLEALDPVLEVLHRGCHGYPHSSSRRRGRLARLIGMTCGCGEKR